jgi:ABC-type amino acid transport substrate-binding protein
VLAAIVPRQPLAPASLVNELPPVPTPVPARGTRLDLVHARGSVRVAFFADSIPWAFLNAAGTPVGFDAEMAHQLALALGVRLEHISVPHDQFAEGLASGQIDVVMSGIRVGARVSALAAFSRPYAEETLAFLTRDHRREEFTDSVGLRRRRVRIAIMARPEWLEALARGLPLAEVVPVRSAADFVEGKVEADALLTSWERACAWSLLYPELAAAMPTPQVGRFSLAYAVPRGEPDMLNMIDTFIDSQRASGRFDAARTHWILGEATRVQRPRWSIVHDVLGFGRRP